MERSAVRKSGDLFRSILRLLRSETDWKVDRQLADPEEQIQAVVNGKRECGELFYSRPDTTARVSITFPAAKTGDAMELLVDNSLDEQLQYSEEGFVGQLCETHEAIAHQHQTPYIEPIADPSLVARARFPVEYDEETLTESVLAIDQIMLETEKLHKDITDSVRQYRDE